MNRHFSGVALVGIAAVSLTLAAPVGAGSTQAAGATRVSVKITARACKLSRKRVPAGTLVFSLKNRSKVAHSLAIAGRRSRKAKPRKKQTFRVTIRRPGRYRVHVQARPWRSHDEVQARDARRAQGKNHAVSATTPAAAASRTSATSATSATATSASTTTATTATSTSGSTTATSTTATSAGSAAGAPARRPHRRRLRRVLRSPDRPHVRS